MNNQTAFKPGVYNDFMSMPAFRNEEQAKKKGVDPEDNALAFMSETEGWKVLRKYIENLKGEADQFVINAVANGMPRDEVGTYAIVGSLLKQALSHIINKIDDAREATTG